MRVFIISIFFALPVIAFGKCNPDVIIFKSSNDFKIKDFSFSGASSFHTSIPVMTPEQRGCWSQESGLDFSMQVDEKKKNGQAVFSFPNSQFEKIEGGRTESYFLLSKIKNDSKSATEAEELVVTSVSFTCLNESVLAIESFEGSFENLNSLIKKRENYKAGLGKGEFACQSTSIFATGAAAANLAISRQEHLLSWQRTEGYDLSVPSRMSQLFQEKMGVEELKRLSDKPKNVSVPSVFVGSSFSFNNSSSSNILSTVLVGKYGCSKEFQEKMKDYHVSSFEKNPLKDGAYVLEFDKRKNKLNISWGDKAQKSKSIFSF